MRLSKPHRAKIHHKTSKEMMKENETIHWRAVILYREDCANPMQIEQKIVWEGLTLQMVLKWKWYFEYRQALLKVKHPKQKVELRMGSYQVPAREPEFRKRYYARKGKLSKVLNDFDKVKREWNSLFPIEADPRYRRTVEKIEEERAKVEATKREYFECFGKEIE
jgi:hypothetical protein